MQSENDGEANDGLPNTKPRKKRVDRASFPDQPNGGGAIPCTLDNVQHMLRECGLTTHFNVIKKRVEVRGADGEEASENHIASLAIANGLSNMGWLSSFIFEIAAASPVNPVADWIAGKPWDGEDRLQSFYATVTAIDDYPSGLKENLLYRWLLSVTAAATLDRRFHCRGVLTLQGPQGIGKTSWVASLMPVGQLRDDFVKRDHHLDPCNKDSIIGAVSHLITEIGELDGAFRRDVARLKGFLTNDCDKLRPPYARSEVEYDRRTVFAATVNDEHFLVDHTGNTRFWTIAVDQLDFQHSVDMQQLFAQLKVRLDGGAQWWLTPDEEEALSAYNDRHRSVSAIEERLLDYIDLDAMGGDSGTYVTATELLKAVDVRQPSNRQCQECGAFLRNLIGPPKRVKGRDKWRVPVADSSRSTVNYGENGQGVPRGDPEDRF